jgi:hypothetical protein
VFPQVIDGLGDAAAAIAGGAMHPVRLTSVNCLTLMGVVIVKFLTVINGHAG